MQLEDLDVNEVASEMVNQPDCLEDTETECECKLP